MPESKTIKIDEITSPKDKRGGDKSQRKASKKSTAQSQARNQPRGQAKRQDKKTPSNPSLGWKALLTLQITQWFLRIKGKPYAKWIIVPTVILVILLIIPVGFIWICWMVIKSIFKPVRNIQ